jgi:hypothetical protein
MSNYKSKKTEIIAISFEEFVEFGKHQIGANVVDMKPLSFEIEKCIVTHESDEAYLITSNDGFVRFQPEHVLYFHDEETPAVMLKSTFEFLFEPIK